MASLLKLGTTVVDKSLAPENACSHSAAGPSQQQVPLSVISQGLMLCHLAFPTVCRPCKEELCRVSSGQLKT